MTLSTLSLTASSLGFLVAVLLGILKAFVPGSGARQDSTIRLLAILLGCGGQLANYLLNTSPATGPGIEGAMGVGFSAGIVAMGIYHTYNGDVQRIIGSVTGTTVTPAPTPATPAPAPTPVPVSATPPAVG